MGKIVTWSRAARLQLHSRLSKVDFQRTKSWLKTGSHALVDLLFPPVCLWCTDELPPSQTGLCQQCCHEFVSPASNFCPRCAKPIPKNTHATSQGCPLCVSKPLRFQRTFSLGVYGDSIRDLVLRMKQARSESLTLAVGCLLADRVRESSENFQPDVVIPVPMHWFRRLTRGVNAAALLAESVSDRLHVPYRPRLVHCRRATKKQGTLLPKERLKNVRGAYMIAPRADLDDRRVLLVDDVMTTGATANELARILLRSGAREVSIAVVARGIGFD